MSLQTRHGHTDEGQGGLGYSFLPAAGHHFLTSWFDSFSALLGFGRGFKRRVVEAARIEDGMSVLDLGCGTGLMALLVKQRYPRCAVTGLDVDPSILKIAARHVAKAGVSVDLVCAPAEKTGLQAASFDVVISTLAFHHLPPQSKEDAAREVARLLRAKGTFLLVDLQPLTKSVPALRKERPTSPRWGFRANTAERLRGVLARAGLAVQDVEPPRTWAFRPWMFAMRGTKPSNGLPPQPEGIGDDGDGAEHHGRAGNHRTEQQAEEASPIGGGATGRRGVLPLGGGRPQRTEAEGAQEASRLLLARAGRAS